MSDALDREPDWQAREGLEEQRRLDDQEATRAAFDTHDRREASLSEIASEAAAYWLQGAAYLAPEIRQDRLTEVIAAAIKQGAQYATRR